MTKRDQKGEYASTARSTPPSVVGNCYVTDKKKLYTLGGCAIHELGKEFNPSEYVYEAHFWRRPTIALCSKRISKFRFDIKQVPADYLNYFINDCSKLQFEELLSQRADSVLVLDLTRDVLAGVIEIEPECYVLNPLQSIHMVEGLEPDTMTKEVAQKIYGKNFIELSVHLNPELFFEVWKKHFEIFARETSAHFDHVVLPRLKYTDGTLNPTEERVFGFERLDHCNNMLERMYEYAESLGNIQLISISDNMYSTGRHVEWGGPHIGHYPKETYAALCQRISDYLGDNDSQSDHYLYTAARHQSAQVEALKDELNALKATLEEVQGSLETQNQGYAEMSVTLERRTTLIESLQASLDNQSHELRDLSASLEERNALIESLHARIAKLSDQVKSSKALAEQPLSRIAKRRVARRTKGLRTILRSRKHVNHKKLTFTRA